MTSQDGNAAMCDHCDGDGQVLEPSRTPEEPGRMIPCANCGSDENIPSPAWAVREYEDLRDDYLTMRAAIIEARRELWWFIENDEENGEAAARAIRIQDEILGPVLA